MSLTINKTNRLKYFFIPGILIILGIFFYTVYFSQKKKDKGYAYIELKLIQVGDGWGYEVLANKIPYIHQEVIPAVSGKHHFKTKEHAELVGNKVIEKMKQGMHLPSISLEELKQMDVLKDTLP